MDDIENMYPKIITDPEKFKQHILIDPRLNNMQKLKHIFDLSKDNLRKNDPQLYYAILAVLHSAKCMKCAGMMTAPSGYFGALSESKEDK